MHGKNHCVFGMPIFAPRIASLPGIGLRAATAAAFPTHMERAIHTAKAATLTRARPLSETIKTHDFIVVNNQVQAYHCGGHGGETAWVAVIGLSPSQWLEETHIIAAEGASKG
jgi:hypothetical protein